MNWFNRDKPRPRYYLLPGMGGRSLRAKRRLVLAWSLAVGVVIAGATGLLVFWLNTR